MNPYFINEPAVISFSGGRSSAYMLYKTLEAFSQNGYPKLPKNFKVVFANTGKEMPQTLDFVRDCGERWNVDITWVELEIIEKKYTTKVVDYETASRTGKPFEELITARKFLPNMIMRFCTSEMKVLRIHEYIRSLGWDDWTEYLGIRADEPRRASKILSKDKELDIFLPLVTDGVTKEIVGKFWEENSFDLQLPNIKGTNPYGNCNLCFLKGGKLKQSLVNAHPDMADWWIEQERRIGNVFRADQPSYETMKAKAENQGQMFVFDADNSISCYCGD